MVARFFALVSLLCIAPSLHAQARLDKHSFPLPDGAITRLGDLHFAQPGHIRGLALAPDDKTIATSMYRRIFLWNAESRKITREIVADEAGTALAFSKSGTLLATGSSSGSIGVWSLTKGEWEWRQPEDKKRESQWVTAVRFVDRDRLLAVSRDDRTVELWNASNGKLQRCWNVEDRKQGEFKGYVFKAVSLSSTGTRMAWLAVDQAKEGKRASAVLVCDTVTGRQVACAKGLRPEMDMIQLLDEGERVLIQRRASTKWPRDLFGFCDDEPEGQGGECSIIKIGDGSELAHFVSRQRKCRDPQVGIGLSLTSTRGIGIDRKTVYTADDLGIIRWDMATGKKLGELRYVNWCAFCADGKRILVADRVRLEFCDVNLRPLQPAHENYWSPYIEYLPDGRLIAEHRDRILTWDATSGKLLQNQPITHLPRMYEFARYDYSLRENTVVIAEDKDFIVRDWRTGKAICQLGGIRLENEWEVRPHFSIDGKRILTRVADKDGGVLLTWHDSQSGRLLGRRHFTKKQFLDVHYCDFATPDGSAIGYATPDSRLAVFDCAKPGTDRILGVSAPESAKDPNRFPIWIFHPSNHFVLASRSHDDKDQGREEHIVFELTSGNKVRRFEIPAPHKTSLRYYDAHLSSDSRLLAYYSSGAITLYETASGRERARIEWPHLSRHFAFAPDCKTLAASCEDSTILIWDLMRLPGKERAPAPTNLKEAEKTWTTLGDADARVGYSALQAFVHAPAVSARFLGNRLKPARSPDQLRATIDDLDSANFAKREAAGKQLAKTPDFAIASLRAKLKQGAASLEQKRRMDDLLAKLESPSFVTPYLREIRAIEVLERIGTSEARKVVESLATGDDIATVTREARLTLSRWK